MYVEAYEIEISGYKTYLKIGTDTNMRVIGRRYKPLFLPSQASTDSESTFQHLVVRHELAISKSMHSTDTKSSHEGEVKAFPFHQLGS